MAKKAKQSKAGEYVACAGSLRSMTSGESKMSKNKRWTQEPGPAGSMMEAKSHFAIKK